jgi:hypothetical protein
MDAATGAGMSVAKKGGENVYYPHTQAVPANVAAKVFNRPYVVTVEVEIPKEGAEGVLMALAPALPLAQTPLHQSRRNTSHPSRLCLDGRG